MSRDRCRACGEDKRAEDFAVFTDADGSELRESSCVACCEARLKAREAASASARRAESVAAKKAEKAATAAKAAQAAQEAKKAKQAKQAAGAVGERRVLSRMEAYADAHDKLRLDFIRAPVVKVSPAELAQCKEALRDYPGLDVRNPQCLIASPCVYSGARLPMCLDLLDLNRRADDSNVVPCDYFVRAAKGRMTPFRFADMCCGIAAGERLSAVDSRAALAMSARYDAAKGTAFAAMCRSVSEYFDVRRFPQGCRIKR